HVLAAVDRLDQVVAIVAADERVIRFQRKVGHGANGGRGDGTTGREFAVGDRDEIVDLDALAADGVAESAEEEGAVGGGVGGDGELELERLTRDAVEVDVDRPSEVQLRIHVRHAAEFALRCRGDRDDRRYAERTGGNGDADACRRSERRLFIDGSDEAVAVSGDERSQRNDGDGRVADRILNLQIDFV